MSLKFTEEYYPNIDDLSVDVISAARAEVVNYLQPLMPDVDLAPGTPTGDLVISPLAAYRAAASEANSRLMSDLDLANVADGIIYSCDFVKAYLGNFAVYDVENLRATGLVRLTFTSGSARTLSKALRFQFGTSDSWALRVSDTTTSEIDLLAAGSSHTGASDTYILAQTSATTWAVDVPVEAAMTAPVVAGSAGNATEVADDLIGITAAITFLTGLPSASLKDLAKMARKTSASLTAGSRASTQSLVLRNWPETSMASPVVPGDVEMQRPAGGGTAALMQPAVDVYLRSARDMQSESQIVRLEYIQPTAGGAKVFRGKVNFLHRPSRVTRVEWSGTTDESVVASHTLFSKPSRADLFGSLHCGTRYEDFYVEITPELDGNSTTLVPLTDIVDAGVTKQYAYFAIDYYADPLLETVSSLLESPSYRPAGVDVIVKSGPLVFFDALEITFTAKTGTKTALTTARSAIQEYARTAGYPDAFRQTEIYDIMRNAGADRVLRVDAVTTVTVSAATRLLNSNIGFPTAGDLKADWTTESDEFRTLSGVTTDKMVPSVIIDGEISPGGPADAWAATARTVRHHVDADNIKFIEV